jgi:hypothetical protein
LVLLAVLVVGAIAQFAWLARSPVELTRIRNSMIAVSGSVDQVNWSTETPPSSAFKMETMAPPQLFVEAANEAGALRPGVQGLQAAIRIGEHLAGGTEWKGGAIQASSDVTYRKIIEEGRGYCADFTQVFTAIAHASGLPVREWGMSTGGFNGEGHAFNEVYDQSLGQWVFVDTHKSFYVRDAGTRRPLSALEFRSRLRSPGGTDSLEIRPIVVRQLAREDDIIGFYRPAADQWFLLLGNNIYSYEANPVVNWLGQYSRAAEQIVAILLGVYPKMMIIESETNEELIAELNLVRWRFFIALAALCCGLTAAGILVWKARRSGRNRP